MRARSTLFVSAASCAFIASAASAQDADQGGDVVKDQIIVTASPIGRSTGETIIGVQVITAEELDRSAVNTIGETLRREPGVSSTFFGPGASRPVIRGLGGNRISVLDNGIGSLDASTTSPDHAVAVEPAAAERIEIVRGAATLLYGSSAAGGVVNVISGRAPQSVPEGGIGGAFRAGGSTTDAGVNLAGALDIKAFEIGDGAIVTHFEGAFRDAGDYNIPDFELSDALREEIIAEGETPDDARDRQRNSNLETSSGSVGASFVQGDSFFGFSASAIDTTYGVPGVEIQPDGSGPTIDLEQRRLDFNSAWNGDLGPFRTLRLRVGYADYEHQEFEPSGEPGTLFEVEGWEGRLELVQKPWSVGAGVINGALGFQWREQGFSAIGDEAFVPPVDTTQYGVFALQDYEVGRWRFDIGGRFEATDHLSEQLGIARGFDAFSVSGGVSFKPSDLVFIGVTGLRTERAPSPEELFSNGFHLATGVFELGDPDLELEVARGVEGTVKIGGERLAIVLNGFYTSYRGFIFDAETGAFEVNDEGEEFPVLQFTASDATFVGFEAQVEAELAKFGAFDIHADAAIDFVRARAEESTTGDLPRIPPLEGLIGVDARSSFVDMRGEVEFAARQNRVGAFELPTDGYALFNAYVTLRPFAQTEGLAVQVSAENLLNDEARLHTSFLKDRVPLPGRNFRVALTGRF